VPKPRRRRTAEDAREAILAAAERHLIEGGPAALRLADLATEVGVSHPAILHHFGSREGLVKAVVARAVRSLQAELLAALGTGPPAGAGLLDRVHEVLATRGHARLMAWLLLAGYEPFDTDEMRTQWRAIIDATHATRTRVAKGAAPPLEDTAFMNVLSALAMFGLAIAGPETFQLAGLGRGARVEARFRAWLAQLLAEHATR